MSTKLKWGILGTGAIAKTFAKALAQSKTGELIAVGSRSNETAEKFGAEFNVPTRHGTYEKFLADPLIQAVYISTPHPSHSEWAIKCAQAGKHILCEKPLTLNHAEAMAVIEAARAHQVFLMEAFMYRCHPQTARVVELIREKKIGDVSLIQASFSFRAGYHPESRLFKNSLGGGGILDVGCYVASMARLIAGAALGKGFAEPLSVQGMGKLHPDTGVDEYAIANLEFPGKILAQISTGVHLSQANDVRIYGTEGQIHIPSPWFCSGDAQQYSFTLHTSKAETITGPSEQGLYGYEIDTVAKYVKDLEAPSPAMSWDDSLGNMWTLDRWRKAIGLNYESEEPAKIIRPSNQPLRFAKKPTMKYGSLPGTSKPVSRLVLGTMYEGEYLKNTHAFALSDYFVECGGNCFDTAWVYWTEPLFGQWMKNRGLREELVVIGKGAHTPHCHPEGLTRELYQSLEKMQTDYVDLYLMHRDNVDVPVGEFVDVLNEHLRAGRMRAFGGSNWSIERLEAANAYAKDKGLVGFSAVSNNFSLARMVEPVWGGCIASSDVDSKAWFKKSQMPLLSWSSQARGFFVRGSRSYTADAELNRCWYSDDNFERQERVNELAKKKKVLPINIAAAYVLQQEFPTFALIGPRTLEEIRTGLQALEVNLTPEEVKWLNLES
jgi:predicted dehydrogenase/aryl-alcohol dehydrogenase-like predicted oxidoreductase